MDVKERLKEPDMLRCLAALAVIAQHILGAWGRRGKADFYTLIAVLFELTRFAVPAFIFLAGFTQARTKAGNFKYGPYLLKRIRTIFLPYLIWTLLYMWQSKALTDAGAVFEALFKGSAAYHLWYVPLVLQFTLLAFASVPLFQWLSAAERPAISWGTAIAAAYALMCVLYRTGSLLPGSFIAEYNYRLFPAWLFFYILGAAWGRYYRQLLDLACRLWYLPAAVSAIETWRIIKADLAYINAKNAVSFSLVSCVQPGFALAAAFEIIFILVLAKSLCTAAPLASAATFVSRQSYPMYLAHVMAINHINRQLVVHFPNNLKAYYLILYLLVCLGSLAPSFFSLQTVQRLKNKL